MAVADKVYRATIYLNAEIMPLRHREVGRFDCAAAHVLIGVTGLGAGCIIEP